MPADMLAHGQRILSQQPFSAMLNARLDAFAPCSAELSVPVDRSGECGKITPFK